MRTSFIFLLALLPVLAACHRDARRNWQGATAVPALEIPADLDRPGRSAEMRVPGAQDVITTDTPDPSSPPTSIALLSSADVAATWAAVAARLERSAGSVSEVDGAGHSARFGIRGDALPERKRGFMARLLADKAEPLREYAAMISVDSENGETLVNINGDGRAVLYLDDLLLGDGISNLGDDDKGVNAPLDRRNALPGGHRAIPDASGRSDR